MFAFAKLKLWFCQVFTPPPPLSYMRCGPDERLKNANPLMIQFFTWDCLHDHLSWWEHFEAEIPRLAKLGVTQVWLPPPTKAYNAKGRGYDAYDLWDLGEFGRHGVVETRWGTREQLLRACNVAKENGIDILIDAVLNHKLGGDHFETFQAVPVEATNRLKEAGPKREIEGWTSFDYPSRGDKYSSFHWNREHFTGVDWDNKTKKKTIYRITAPGNKGWSHNVDTELGNYDFLQGCDIDHRHPAVRKDLENWGEWILQTTGASGFRLDAIKHMDRKYILRWIKETRHRSGKKDMFVASEFWSGNLKLILPYIKAFKGETTFFDVPLHMNFNRASRERNGFDLRTVLNDTIVQVKPDDAVTFVDNHDTVEGQTLESWVGDNFKTQAYAIILLRGSGLPCLFYGDIYPNKQCYNENTARNILSLVEARGKYAYGATEDCFAEKNCIGFVRKGDAAHPGCAVILSNKEDMSYSRAQSFRNEHPPDMPRPASYVHELRMNVGIENAGKMFESHMQQQDPVKIDEEGRGIFTCFANSVQVWTASS